jgi:hypothetical protein
MTLYKIKLQMGQGMTLTGTYLTFMAEKRLACSNIYFHNFATLEKGAICKDCGRNIGEIILEDEKKKGDSNGRDEGKIRKA